MKARKPFVIFLTIVMVLILLPVLAPAENIPAKGTPEWIEYTLDLDNQDHTWTYNESSDTYSLSVVSAVAYPVLPDYQGVSVAVPGAYVKGLDSKGNLIIDYKAKIVNPNGVTYTAATAPVILNTGAAGYGDQRNQQARGQRSQYGYVEVACGNRGKQSIVRDDNGKALYYTGDAPSCLVDQKAAARWVKYNILLKNLPGSIDHFVSTGGSGGAAHATMFAATSNNPDFYPYEAEVGAVGVYKDTKTGKYVSKLTDGTPLSDGAWGSQGFSTISSLYEADAGQAFEYYLSTEFEFKSPFQEKMAEYLSEEYMKYINSQNLVADGKKLIIQYDLKKHPETRGYYGTYLDYMEKQAESDLEWYLNNLEWSSSWTKDDPKMSDQEAFLKGAYTSTESGRGGGPPGGNMGSDPGGATAGTVGAAGTGAAGAGAIGDAASGAAGGPGGNMGGGPPGMGGGADTAGKGAAAAGLIGDVEVSTSSASAGGPGGDMGGGMPGGDMGGRMGGPPGMGGSSSGTGTPTPGVDITSWVKYKVKKDGTYSVDFDLADFLIYRGAKMNKPVPGFDTITYSQEVWVFGNAEKDGRHFSVFVNNVFSDPAKAAVLKPLYSTTDSNVFLDANGNADFDAMVAAHKAEYAEIAKGDKYGNNIVDLYNPVRYIGAEGTEDPAWSRIMMGGVEGDIALVCSLNIAIKWKMAGVKDVILQWQWNGGHVPGDIFSMSFAGHVDQMFSK